MMAGQGFGKIHGPLNLIYARSAESVRERLAQCGQHSNDRSNREDGAHVQVLDWERDGKLHGNQESRNNHYERSHHRNCNLRISSRGSWVITS